MLQYDTVALYLLASMLIGFDGQHALLLYCFEFGHKELSPACVVQ